MADQDLEQTRLIKEIDEELRHERLAKLWKAYGNWVIGAALVLVLGVAAFQGWTAYDRDRRNTESERFSAALDAIAQDKVGDAEQVFTDLAANGTEGYAMLSRFNEAALLARDGKADAARAAYAAIAADSGIVSLYRDLAVLLSALNDVETVDWDVLIKRVTPLADAANPWRHSAREIIALAARRAGDTERAKSLYREIAEDASAPVGIRTRAAEMTAILGG